MGIADKYIEYANHMAQIEPEKGWELYRGEIL